MSHPFHTGRYSGAATIPRTDVQAQPAAALVLYHDRMAVLEPMFRQLDAHPSSKPVREMRLVPIVVADFYARAH